MALYNDTMIVALHVPMYIPYRQSVDDLDNPNPLYPEHREWFNASRVLRNRYPLTLGDVGGRWDGCSKRVQAANSCQTGVLGNERQNKICRSVIVHVDERRS